MLTTRRYEYLQVERVGVHHELTNHRPLDAAKVRHLEKDILANGLLEPLVVWERNPGEYYLVGGFHRMEAIAAIRKKNPGYFDRVDVRVVAGDPDEIKALNLKLNSDRVDTRITDYFQTVLYLKNANWAKEKIAEFFDKSVGWIEEIVRFAPLVTPAMQEKLASGGLSWNRAREILQRTLKGPAGREKETIESELSKPKQRPARPVTLGSAIGRLRKAVESKERRTYAVTAEDLYSLFLTLQGKDFVHTDVERIRRAFPFLLENGKKR